MQDYSRADSLAPVVRPHETARRARNEPQCATGAWRSSRRCGKRSTSSGWRTSRTGAYPADMVGAPHPRLVLRRLRTGICLPRGHHVMSQVRRPVRQESDVLDTWFSSGLWPFSTLGWPDATDDLKTFYPTSLLVTGFDILFFWVARMIMMGMHFMGDVPFQRRLHPRPREGRGRQEDEQVEGERHRPSRDNRQLRDGLLPVHLRHARRPGQGRAPVGGAHRGQQELRQQDMERRPADDVPPGKRAGPVYAAPALPASCRTGGSGRACKK